MLDIGIWCEGCGKKVVSYASYELASDCKLLLHAGLCKRCADENIVEGAKKFIKGGRCVK